MTPVPGPGDLRAAASALDQAHRGVHAAPSYRDLPPARQAALVDDLERIRRALTNAPRAMTADPYSNASLARQMAPFSGQVVDQAPGNGDPAADADGAEAAKPVLRAVSQLPAAAGAVADELDFAAFVASLVHGVFDAIVDSSIRQMEAFADLVASLAQDVDSFAQRNVTRNQVRDWLHERHPNDLTLELPENPGDQPRLLPRLPHDDDAFGGFAPTPAWLDDYGFDGEALSEDFIETRLIPAARRHMGEDRMRTLATMVLMGINRVKVDRGEISARIRIRAAASDHAQVDFATSQDGSQQSSGWGGRMGFMHSAAQPTAMVSTTLNAQADGQIAAELLGEVRISFSSETLPLERFADEAARVLLERAARRAPRRSQRQAPEVEEAQTVDPPALEAPVDATPAAPPATPPSTVEGAP